MPTPFPRLSVIVSPEQHQLLADLGGFQGRSSASYVRHLVDLATPTLRALHRRLQAAAKAEDTFDDSIQVALDALQDDADEQLHLELDAGLDQDGAGAGARGGDEAGTRAGPEAAERPRTVTTGVR